MEPRLHREECSYGPLANYGGLLIRLRGYPLIASIKAAHQTWDALPHFIALVSLRRQPQQAEARAADAAVRPRAEL